MIYKTENYLFTVEFWVEKSNKIILLGLTGNFIFVPHFVKWKYFKITATTLAKCSQQDVFFSDGSRICCLWTLTRALSLFVQCNVPRR